MASFSLKHDNGPSDVMRCGEFNYINDYQPIKVAARSKAGICGLSIAGVAGFECRKGGMNICLLWVLCVDR